MTRLLATTALAVALATPAWAIGTYDPSYPPPAPVTNTNTVTQKLGQTQGQTANSSVRVKINNGTGGATGAAPASTTASPASGFGGGGGTRVIGQAPDIFLPSIGGGGADCPTVGFGAAGSGLSGGGGFGPSWISTRCDHRKYAELIYQLTGDRQKALAYLASVESDVKQWLDATPISTTTALPPASEALHGTAGTDGYCSERMTWAEHKRHPECGK